MERLSVSDGDRIAVVYSPPPESIRSIRRKIEGSRLTASEMIATMDTTTGVMLLPGTPTAWRWAYRSPTG